MAGMNDTGYIPNGGQTYYPAKDRPDVPTVPYTPCRRTYPDWKPELLPQFKDSDFVLVGEPVFEELLGITPDMLDWFWANMEKCYFLWAPGVHAGFAWDPSPAEVGYAGSSEVIYEFDLEKPGRMTRQSIENYPFTECFDHCWLSNRPFRGGGPDDRMWLIHMYREIPGGTEWSTIRFIKREHLEVFQQGMAAMKAGPEHALYESGRFKEFLPQMYAIWKDHPDPYQNVHFDLRVKRNEDGTWSHISDNLPPHLKK